MVPGLPDLNNAPLRQTRFEGLSLRLRHGRICGRLRCVEPPSPAQRIGVGSNERCRHHAREQQRGRPFHEHRVSSDSDGPSGSAPRRGQSSAIVGTSTSEVERESIRQVCRPSTRPSASTTKTSGNLSLPNERAKARMSSARSVHLAEGRDGITKSVESLTVIRTLAGRNACIRRCDRLNFPASGCARAAASRRPVRIPAPIPE